MNNCIVCGRRMPFEHDLFFSFGCKNKEENKMTEIKGILLVPEEGDPRGLLKLGPCDARPPMAFVWDSRYLRLPEDDGRWQACCPSWPKPGDALVLAWDGDVIQEGLDKAITEASMELAWYKMDYETLNHRLFWLDEIVQWAGAALAELLNCKLVLIDAEGREVSNE